MGCYLDIYVKQILLHKEFNKIGPSPHKFYSFYRPDIFAIFRQLFVFQKKKKTNSLIAIEPTNDMCLPRIDSVSSPRLPIVTLIFFILDRELTRINSYRKLLFFFACLSDGLNIIEVQIVVSWSTDKKLQRFVFMFVNPPLITGLLKNF